MTALLRLVPIHFWAIGALLLVGAFGYGAWSFADTYYDRGVQYERAKWINEMAQVKEAAEKARKAAEQRIAEIGRELAQTEQLNRELADELEQAITEAERSGAGARQPLDRGIVRGLGKIRRPQT